MAGRSPARFLAPLALVAAAVALVLVVSSSSTDPERVATPGSALDTNANGGGTTTTSGKEGGRKRRERRFYRVKPGDTPSGIAEKTGVPLEDILSLNPTLDPQTLAPGTRIRLRR
ncbi:MAG TPA: LysM domain-containing protein [Solirubrobacteraceae bacterium]|nr:LysM domain-containing protein [Solirubrobacteraceae bacterium]